MGVIPFQVEITIVRIKYIEDDGLYANSRKGFIRKIYTIVSIQLLITALVTVWAMNS